MFVFIHDIHLWTDQSLAEWTIHSCWWFLSVEHYLLNFLQPMIRLHFNPMLNEPSLD